MGVNFVDAPPADDAPAQQPQATEPVATPTEPTPVNVGSSFDNSAEPQAYAEPAPAADSSDDVSD